MYIFDFLLLFSLIFAYLELAPCRQLERWQVVCCYRCLVSEGQGLLLVDVRGWRAVNHLGYFVPGRNSDRGLCQMLHHLNNCQKHKYEIWVISDSAVHKKYVHGAVKRHQRVVGWNALVYISKSAFTLCSCSITMHAKSVNVMDFDSASNLEDYLAVLWFSYKITMYLHCTKSSILKMLNRFLNPTWFIRLDIKFMGWLWK